MDEEDEFAPQRDFVPRFRLDSTRVNHILELLQKSNPSLSMDEPRLRLDIMDLLKLEYAGRNPHGETFLKTMANNYGLKEENALSVYENLSNELRKDEYAGFQPMLEPFLNQVRAMSPSPSPAKKDWPPRNER
jgi:hypothetical protein